MALQVMYIHLLDSEWSTLQLNVSSNHHFLTPGSPDDYLSVVFGVLAFNACQRRQCLNVSIVDDLVLENTERFSVLLTRTADLDQRITLDPVNGVVDILDNDGSTVWVTTYIHTLALSLVCSGCGWSGADSILSGRRSGYSRDLCHSQTASRTRLPNRLPI